MARVVHFDHVSNYADEFHEDVKQVMNARKGYVGLDSEFLYLTTTQPDGRVLFSVLIIAKEAEKPGAENANTTQE